MPEVLDPAAVHAEEPLDLEPPEGPPLEPDQPKTENENEPLDEYGPLPLSVELVFSTDGHLEDAAAAWKQANALIESAATKGLRLVAGQVYREQSEQELAQQQIAQALADLPAEPPE